MAPETLPRRLVDIDGTRQPGRFRVQIFGAEARLVDAKGQIVGTLDEPTRETVSNKHIRLTGESGTVWDVKAGCGCGSR